MSTTETDTARRHNAVAAYGLALLFLANVFNYADRALLGIVIESVKAELLLTDTQISLISGLAFSMFNLIAGIAIARWVDRGDRRIILILGVLLWTGATAATGLAEGFGSLALCRVLVGVGEATVFPVAMSLLADFYPGPKLQRSVSIFQSSQGVGIVAGSILAGVLAASFGWRNMFLIMGAAGLVLVALIAVTMPKTPRKAVVPGAPVVKIDGLLSTVKQIVAVPGLAWLAFGYSVSHMILASLPTWGPAFLQRSYGVSQAQVGAVIGPPAVLGGFAGAIVAGIIATKLVEKSGNKLAGLTVPIIALPLTIPAFFVHLYAPSIPVLMLATLVMNFMIASTHGPCIALAVSRVPPSQRGLTSTLVLTLMALIAGTLSPLIVGMASDAMAPTYGDESLRYALSLLLVTPLIASFLIWFARRRMATGLPPEELGGQGSSAPGNAH